MPGYLGETLSVSIQWGIMGTNDVKNGVGFNCVLVNLVIVVCFTGYVNLSTMSTNLPLLVV